MKSPDLTILHESDIHVTKGGHRLKTYMVRCVCGVEFKVLKCNVDSGHTTSCGCSKYRLPTYHGQRGTPIYTSWDCMVQRCTNSRSAHYKNYGARGVTICSEWRDFKTFQAWASTNGWQEGLELDRIDNNGNYEPRNCRWVTPAQNNLNKRDNRLITFGDQTKTLKEWATLTGLRSKTIQGRLDILGWSVNKALTTPPKYNCARTAYAHLFRDIRTEL